MLLRESGQNGKDEIELRKITSEDGLGNGVPHGDELVRFVNATLREDDAALVEARQAVVDVLGTDGMIDAAGVIGTFTMQNRVADATGLPLDTPLEMATRGLRTELGVNDFGAAAYTAQGGWGRALLARIVEPVLPLLFKMMGGRTKERG